MDNKYISRYSNYDTHYHRTDPWKHVPWDFQQKKHHHFGEIAIVIVCAAILVAANVLVRM